jgi:UDP-glucose 4-epimerase
VHRWILSVLSEFLDFAALNRFSSTPFTRLGNKTMRILLIGGAGFLGSHIVDCLLETGADLRVFGRSPERFRPPLAGVDYRRGDVCDVGALADALSGVDLVYHLVSSTTPASSNLDPQADVQTNLIGTLRLLDAMRAADVKRLIYLSSGGTVYGIPQTNLVTESHPQRPICSYGVVKAAIEHYLLMEQHLHGLLPVILRVSNPYGPRQAQNTGQGLIATLLGALARDEPLHIWGDGTVVRDFLYVRDAAQVFASFASNPLTGVFNVARGEGSSILQVLDLAEVVTRRKPRLEFRASRAHDVPRIVLDISRIRARAGWQPQTTLQQGLARTWQWTLELEAQSAKR